MKINNGKKKMMFYHGKQTLVYLMIKKIMLFIDLICILRQHNPIP